MGRLFEEAEETVRLYGTRDPYELLDAIGAVTKFSRKYRKNGLKGFAMILFGVSYAVVNAKLDDTMQRIVAGHEAAHLILHRSELESLQAAGLIDYDMFSGSESDKSRGAVSSFGMISLQNSRIEREANEFLADFLVSDSSVKEALSDEYADFFTVSSELAMPYQLFAYKLHSMEARGYKLRSPIGLDSKFLAD
ncbi:hypothetical protein FACS1894105_10020 [Clostridia bacterium]|nr:hypothetical protein FACS1894105_10020 [Clostridia bacterium]